MFVRFKLVWLNDMQTAGIIPLIGLGGVIHANELSVGAVPKSTGFVPVLVKFVSPKNCP